MAVLVDDPSAGMKSNHSSSLGSRCYGWSHDDSLTAMDGSSGSRTGRGDLGETQSLQ